jgi:HK97 family phage portal protein
MATTRNNSTLVTADGVFDGAMMGGDLGAKAYTVSQLAQQFITGADSSPVGGNSLGGPRSVYRDSLWFHACVSRIASNASRVPLRLSVGAASGTTSLWGLRGVRAGRLSGRKVRQLAKGQKSYKATEGEIVEGGELYDLLTKPDGQNGWNHWMAGHEIYKHAYGRVHWVMLDMVGRRPTRMALIPGKRSRPITRKGTLDEQIIGWSIAGPDGVRYPVPIEEVITFHFFDPDDPLGGLSPRVPGRLAIIADYNASHYNAAMFANSCEPGTVLTSDQPFDPESDSQIKGTWSQRHTGPGNARRLAILWGGLKHDSVANSLNEMVYAEGKQLNAVEICAVCNVPPAVAGLLGTMGDSDAFVESEKKRFWQDTIAPELDGVNDVITSELCPRFDQRLESWFDLEQVPIYQDMRRSQTDTAVKMFSLGVPVSDLNEWLDLALPARPHHDTAYLPSGMIPVDEARTPLPPMPEGPEPDEDDPADPDKSAPRQARGKAIRNPQSAIKRPRPVELSDQVKTRIWKRWERSFAPLAKSQAHYLRNHYSALARKIVGLIGEYFGDGDVGGDGQKATTKDDLAVSRIMAAVFDDRGEQVKLRERIRQFAADAGELGVRQVLTEAGIVGEALAQQTAALTGSPIMQAQLADDAANISTRISGLARKHVRNHLRTGLAGGESPQQLATRIQDYFDGQRKAALNQARNYVGQTLSASRQQAMPAAGITHELWIHSRGPGDRRPAHIAAEGHYANEPKPLGQMWNINGAQLRYPRDPAGPPAETVNCQCVSIGRRIVADGTSRQLDAEAAFGVTWRDVAKVREGNRQ